VSDLRKQEEDGQLVQPVLFVLLVLVSVLLYFAVSLMDPGFILSDDNGLQVIHMLMMMMCVLIKLVEISAVDLTNWRTTRIGLIGIAVSFNSLEYNINRPTHTFFIIVYFKRRPTNYLLL